MKKFIIKLIALLIGIGLGIYASSKLNILEDVVGTFTFNFKGVIKSEEKEQNPYINDLILVNAKYDGVVIDLRYNSKNNILNKNVYESNLAYLQKSTLDKLIKVNEELKTKGYRLKIWDAYRPLSIQKKIWAKYPNKRYVDNPFTKGSNNSRGASVDVTLVTLKGDKVNMPTDFETFTLKSSRDYKWSEEVTKNVKLLTDTMAKHGFEEVDSVWWHFDDVNYSEYEIMDYDFRELIKK